MDKIQKDIEDILYELRTLRSLLFFTFFLNAFVLLYIFLYYAISI